MTPDQEDDFDPRMTVGEHLEALRGHVLKAILYIAAIAVVCFIYQKPLMNWATWPHQRVQSKLIQESRVKDAPAELQSLVGDVDQRSKDLDKALAKVGRQVAAAHDKLEPTQGRLETLHERQAKLLEEASALVARADALASQDAPDKEALEALRRDRAALAKKRSALRLEVSQAAGPFIDRFAKVPRFELAAIKYQEPFLSYLKLAIVAAIFLASPLVVWELWKFVGVGLYPHEKKYLKFFAPLSLIMFILGGLFGYFLLIPIGLYFLATYAPPELVTGTFSMGAYLSLFITMTLVVGMVFQLPLVMSFFTLIGVLNHKQYREYRGYAWLGGAITAAVLTPPDPVTQLLMLGPMGILYEVGIFASMMIGDRRKQTEEEASIGPSSPGSSGSGGPASEAGEPAALPGPSAERDADDYGIEDPPGYDPDAEPEDDPDDPDIEIQPAVGAVARGSLEPEPEPADEAEGEEPQPEPTDDAGDAEAEAEESEADDDMVGDGDNEDPTSDYVEEGPVSDAPWRGPEAVDPEPDPEPETHAEAEPESVDDPEPAAEVADDEDDEERPTGEPEGAAVSASDPDDPDEAGQDDR